MKIYVASSWRNTHQPAVVQELRAAGHQVYDFRDPRDDGTGGFSWSSIDPDWKSWTPEAFRLALDHQSAERGFDLDMDALEWCDACVLVLPCGRSAHLELGHATGSGKMTIVLLADGEPELMYKMVDSLCLSVREVLDALELHVLEEGPGAIAVEHFHGHDELTNFAAFGHHDRDLFSAAVEMEKAEYLRRIHGGPPPYGFQVVITSKPRHTWITLHDEREDPSQCVTIQGFMALDELGRVNFHREGGPGRIAITIVDAEEAEVDPPVQASASPAEEVDPPCDT